MCGVAAVIWYGDGTVQRDQQALYRASDRMECRGPDGSGHWYDEGGHVALTHRRLAIIDLTEAGAQPMVSPDGKLAITFNGEIYNYRALRQELEAKGHHFRSESDTEVLLHLYAEKGENFVNELRGMFAFALWDGRRQGLLIGRDPFGVKPLYFAEKGGEFRVASEVKALLAAGDLPTSPDAAGHVGFFLWGHVPEPYTLFKSIRAVPAGATMWIDRTGRRDVRQYADLRALFSTEPRGSSERQKREDPEAALRNLLLDSVRHHLVADVEVGVFLSAGLDSATLAALASEVGGQLRTVTLGFDEYRGTQLDETTIAEDVARRYGTKHETVWVTKQDFFDELGRFIDRMDQPTVDGINSFFVARAAREAGLKVALSGLGGDELLGGYPSFRQIPRLVSLVGRMPARQPLGRGFRRLAAPLFARFTSPKYAGLFEYGGAYSGAYLLRRGMFLPWELPSVLDQELVREGLDELEPLTHLETTTHGISGDRLKISSLEASWYMRNQLLRDTDWASMSHSIEVRVPLVDWVLWKEVAALLRVHPTLSKKTMSRTPAMALPASVLSRRKTGFVVPTRAWLNEQPNAARDRGLRGWARQIYGLAA